MHDLLLLALAVLAANFATYAIPHHPSNVSEHGDRMEALLAAVSLHLAHSACRSEPGADPTSAANNNDDTRRFLDATVEALHRRMAHTAKARLREACLRLERDARDFERRTSTRAHGHATRSRSPSTSSPPCEFATRRLSPAFLLAQAVHRCHAETFRWLVRALLPPGVTIIQDQQVVKLLLNHAFRVDCPAIADDLLRRFSTLGINGDIYYRPLIQAIRLGGDTSRVLTVLFRPDGELDVNAVQLRSDNAEEGEVGMVANGGQSIRYLPITTGVYGTTALAMAAFTSREILLVILLHRGADPWLETGIAWRTVLHTGDVRIAHMFLRCLQLPVRHSHDIVQFSIRSMVFGETPLHPALFRWMMQQSGFSKDEEHALVFEAIDEGRADALIYLLSCNVDVDMVRAVIMAVSKNDLSVLSVLLSHDAPHAYSEPIRSTTKPATETEFNLLDQLVISTPNHLKEIWMLLATDRFEPKRLAHTFAIIIRRSAENQRQRVADLLVLKLLLDAGADPQVCGEAVSRARAHWAACLFQLHNPKAMQLSWILVRAAATTGNVALLRVIFEDYGWPPFKVIGIRLPDGTTRASNSFHDAGLFAAVVSRHHDAAHYFLETLGANPMAFDNAAIRAALRHRDRDMVELLSSYGGRFMQDFMSDSVAVADTLMS